MSPGQGVPTAGEGALVVKISPLDIRRQVFRKTMRGCDPEEVRTFLEMVANELENALQDKAMLGERCQMQEQRLEEYRQLEQSMRNSLVTADRIATESRDASEREAQRVVQDSHARAERILGDARERLQTLVQEIESLRAKREVFLQRFRGMLDSQLALLESHGGDPSDIEILERGAARLSSRIEGSRPIDSTRPLESSRTQERTSEHARPASYDRQMGERQAGERQATERQATERQATERQAPESGPGRDFASHARGMEQARPVEAPQPSGYGSMGHAPTQGGSAVGGMSAPGRPSEAPRSQEPRLDDEYATTPSEPRSDSSRPRIPIRRSENLGEPQGARPAQPEPTAEGISRGVGRFFRRNDAVVPLRAVRPNDPRSSDPRSSDPRSSDPRTSEPRSPEARPEARGDARDARGGADPGLFSEARGGDPKSAVDPRAAERRNTIDLRSPRTDEDGRLRERAEGVFEISAADEAAREDRGRSA